MMSRPWLASTDRAPVVVSMIRPPVLSRAETWNALVSSSVTPPESSSREPEAEEVEVGRQRRRQAGELAVCDLETGVVAVAQLNPNALTLEGERSAAVDGEAVIVVFHAQAVGLDLQPGHRDVRGDRGV